LDTREKKQNLTCTSVTNYLLNRNPVGNTIYYQQIGIKVLFSPIELELKTAVIPNFVDGNCNGKLF
jgi:hypothetical protein